MPERSMDIVLTRRQVREVDRRAIEDYGVPGIVLMENAGHNAARHIRRFLEASNLEPGEACPVAIVCGRGNNGGDGFVIARHLANIGVPVEVFLAGAAGGLAGDAATNYEIVRRMAIKCHEFDTMERIRESTVKLQRAPLIVDAILGTGFRGDVRLPLDSVIDCINRIETAKVVAVDLPSGLDCDTGRAANATIRAELTISFVARKAGFLAPGASDYTGRVCVADIGAPRDIIHAVVSSGGSG